MLRLNRRHESKKTCRRQARRHTWRQAAVGFRAARRHHRLRVTGILSPSPGYRGNRVEHNWLHTRHARSRGESRKKVERKRWREKGCGFARFAFLFFWRAKTEKVFYLVSGRPAREYGRFATMLKKNEFCYAFRGRFIANCGYNVSCLQNRRNLQVRAREMMVEIALVLDNI